jgi:hypothetical protein
MPKKTITKILPFVITLSAAVLFAASCGEGRGTPAFDKANSAYEEPRVAGRIASDEVRESSGLAASLCQPGVLWTHNDSGDGPFLYAISPTGESLGVWRVSGAENEDWEDIASRRAPTGVCYLYIGETGNTDKLTRSQGRIYRVREPELTAGRDNLSKRQPAETAPAEFFAFRYPDGNHDSETLIVNPSDESIYMLTKSRSEPSGVYKLPPRFDGSLLTSVKVGEIKVPAVPFGLLTGGEASPDGKSVILCDYAAGYELTLPDGMTDFDAIWRQTPVPVRLGERKQGEAVTYSVDGKMIYATSEGKNSPIIVLGRNEARE